MKQNRRIVYVLLALLFLSAAFCVFSFAWGTAQNLSRHRQMARLEQIKSKKKDISSLRQEHAAWKRAGQDYHDFIGRYFIPRDDFSSFRRRLNELLEANLLSSQNLVFQTATVAGGFQKIVIRFTVNSGYGSIKKLIHDISALDHMAILSRIDLGNANRQVNAHLQLEVYLD